LPGRQNPGTIPVQSQDFVRVARLLFDTSRELRQPTHRPARL
jgi:hypothetical protein